MQSTLLAALLLTAHGLAAAPPAKTATPSSSQPDASSEADARSLAAVLGAFDPEVESWFGLAAFDTRAIDLGPRRDERRREALARVERSLRKRIAAERDVNVRVDLELVAETARRERVRGDLEARTLLPWVDAPQVAFRGIATLLREGVPAERRTAAARRLRAYLGGDGGPSVFTLARARTERRVGEVALLRPQKRQVEACIEKVQTYVDGLRALFSKYELRGSEADLDRFAAEAKAYADWVRERVLPSASTNPQVPRDLYEARLAHVGVDVDADVLIERAYASFVEVRRMLAAVATTVAQQRGFADASTPAVMRELRRERLAPEAIEPHYRRVMGDLEALIERHGIATLPPRPMQMRLGTPAEAAASPAPHYAPPPLVGNRGELGVFVLPLATGGGDDFTYPAAAWALAAHEGRPGHDLQITRMVDAGIPFARARFALDSASVEGWALYAETEVLPFLPVEAQAAALQLRLLRAARAFLDPMLALGRMSRAEAERVLTAEVGVSESLANQELDRYLFASPGQATSYFHGLAELLALRARVELAQGATFDRRAFNDFVLAQGPLPARQLERLVAAHFGLGERRGGSDRR